MTLADAIREHVLATVWIHNWNLSAAARELRIHRQSLQRMLKKWGIRKVHPVRA